MNYAARKLAKRIAKFSKNEMFGSMSYNNKAGSPKYVQVTRTKFGFRVEFENGVIQSFRETPNVADTILGTVDRGRPERPSDFPLPHLLHIGTRQKTALESLIESLLNLSSIFAKTLPTAGSVMQQLCAVQPMTKKIGQVFFMNKTIEEAQTSTENGNESNSI